MVPPVSRVSSTNAPSRIEIIRSAVAAIRASWVTMTSVWPGLVQALEEPEDVEGGGAVQVAGRLVGEHDQRLVAQRPGDRDPLPLAAGQRGGQEPRPVGEPDPLQQLLRTPPGGPRRASGQQRRQLDVLDGGELLHQVEGLEDEADIGAPHPGQGLLADVVDAATVQPDLTARGPVQPAEQVQQRRLPAAAGPHHRHRLPGADVEVDPVDGAHQSFPLAVVLSQPAGAQDGCVGGVAHDPLLRCGPARLTGLEPAQVRLEPEHDALQQQRRVRAVRLGHRGALGVTQPAQQLAALGVDDGQRVGQPGRRGRDQLEVELREVGLGPAHLGHPLGDPLVAVGGQRVHLAIRPVGASGSSSRPPADRPSPAGSA